MGAPAGVPGQCGVMSEHIPAAKGLLAGYGVMAAGTCAAVLADGTQRTGLALGLLAVAAFAIATRVTAPVALAAAAMGWLFYAGFITGRHGDLAWQGTADAQRAEPATGLEIRRRTAA